VVFYDVIAMLFFIDESWQQTRDERFKVGVLAAIHFKSHDYNDCSNQIFNLKLRHMGPSSRESEMKGKNLLKEFCFNLEAKGIKSNGLTLAREILDFLKCRGARVFASVVFSAEEINLSCTDENKLERPFFYLFERIDLFMKENYPDVMAHLIFDDRGVQSNQRISKSISNFFHRSSRGQSFANIVKVPFFAISSENIGIQAADICAYIIAARFSGDKKKREFFSRVKEAEFLSRTPVDIGGRKISVKGIKVIKEKEAGDLLSPGRTK
jgi:hypothetical protein